MMGVKNFSAIINPPQSCILAVGAAEKRPVQNEKSEKGYDIGTFMANEIQTVLGRTINNAVIESQKLM
jgi:pyruvate/2-oxoglutarate dehydrogenase complex dihydrolipoamide acyltransferase (E2) component